MAKVVDFCRRNLAWVLLILICVVFTFTSPNFLSVTNLLNILNQNAYVIISAYGIALIMMSGGLDMSVGYQMSICGVLCAMMIMHLNFPIVLTLCSLRKSTKTRSALRPATLWCSTRTICLRWGPRTPVSGDA